MVWLTFVLLVVCGSLVATVVLQHRRLAALDAEIVEMYGDATVEVIAIEIQNHLELAASRSPFARPLAMVTPGILKGIVHRETLKMMRSELAENGVVADVRSRRVPVRRTPTSVDHDDAQTEDPEL